MLVTLAFPFDSHDPDETIEVDDFTGRNLVRDGMARLADDIEDSLGGIAELRAYAADHDIDITGLRSKVDIAAAIETAEQDRATTSETPPGADN